MKKMNTGWGGNQAKMHESKIPNVEGYLGSNPRVLDPGMVKIVLFGSCLGNVGPFHMSAGERNAKKKYQAVEFLMGGIVENLVVKGMDASIV